ncbi:MAG: ABC transporter substrate-binding protein, partial [Hyphomicrobiaceae bacterium]
THNGRLVGVPFDIPIFTMFYRRDVLDDLGLSVPQTMDEYIAVVEAIHAARAPMLYGSTGQMRADHYSLNCEWTAWLWAHGGSIFDADGLFVGGDEYGLEGLRYMLRLKESMPPHVTEWTWDGQIQSVLMGLAGITLTWGEFFPSLDDSSQSRVVGLMEAAPPPRAKTLRRPEDCGYGEIPNTGHQGGSVLSLSRYGSNLDAAWIFLQWATSADVQTRASLLGGGASPTRASAFEDQRIKQAAGVGPGTTRHFAAVRQTIEEFMGSEPDVPVWPELSNGVIPHELGRLLRGVHRDPSVTMANIKMVANNATRAYRR